MLVGVVAQGDEEDEDDLELSTEIAENFARQNSLPFALCNLEKSEDIKRSFLMLVDRIMDGIDRHNLVGE